MAEKKLREERYWFVSYVWELNGGGNKFVNEVTNKHPLKMVKEWKDKYDGNNESVLLTYYEITKKEFNALVDYL